jgi:hypothetical protein
LLEAVQAALEVAYLKGSVSEATGLPNADILFNMSIEEVVSMSCWHSSRSIAIEAG